MNQDKITLAARYAEFWHAGQLYNELPYVDEHVTEVVRLAVEFMGADYDWEIEAAAWLHDAVEDVPKQERDYYAIVQNQSARANLIREEISEGVAMLVVAVTGFGPNRKARNKDIYDKIRNDARAAFLKAVDRLANARNGQRFNLRLHGMYRGEYQDFRPLVSPHISELLLKQLDIAHQ